MKKGKLLISMVFLLTLAGCSKTDVQEVFEARIAEYELQKSDDDSYIQYKTLKEEGKIDEDGRYNELGEYAEEYAADRDSVEDLTDNGAETKQVHITFAWNNYLTVNYFYDEECSELIDGDECYLDPGESIYASMPESTNPYTNSYVFSEFRIYEYDSTGNRSKNPNMSSNRSKVLTIPEDFTGSELSVEPIGEYQRRSLSFDAYIIDKTGSHKAIAGGIWKVNEEEYIDDTVELNPSEAYTVKYCYNTDEYYVVDSAPSYYSNSNGVVEFKKATAMDVDDSYSVQLHPYLTVSLEGDSESIKSIKSIKVNENEYSLLDDRKIRQLKVGDTITLETVDGYRLYCSQSGGDLQENSVNDVCRYTFKVPESNEEIRLHISKTTLKIRIDSNVGSDILFDIEAYGVSKSGCVYEQQRFGGDCLIVDDTIGAEESIVISAREGILPSNQALRIDIVKTDSNENKTNEIVYISALPGSQSVSVYENGTVDNSSKIYKSIDIKISRVDTMIYKQAEVINGSIEVSFTDVDINKELRDGDTVEESRKVEVVIKPFEGYYVSGKKVSDDTYSYSDTMTFKKYASDIDKIIKAHSIKKLIQVTLDTSDDYGTCEFKVDGKVISGEVKLKSGQEVVLEYILEDSDYEITREAGGIFDTVVTWGEGIFSKDKERISIEITDTFEGTVITRENYIKVEKK